MATNLSRVTAVHEAAHLVFFIMPCERYDWGEGFINMRPVRISIIPNDDGEGGITSERHKEVVSSLISDRRRVWHILGLLAGYASEVALGLTEEDKADADCQREVGLGIPNEFIEFDPDLKKQNSDYRKCSYVMGEIVDYQDTERDNKCVEGITILWGYTKALIRDSLVIKATVEYVADVLLKQPDMDKDQVYALIDDTCNYMNQFEDFKLKVPLLKSEKGIMTLID